MSSSTPYHQPNAPDSPVDESDSDLDIDLQELDPIATSNPANASKLSGIRQSREERRPVQQHTGRIPLRTLRMGGLKGNGNRNRGYGELGMNRTGGEDTEGLLNGELGVDGARNSAGSGEDEAPLLPGSGSRRRRPSFGLDKVSEIGSRMRLPSFLSNASGAQVPRDEQVSHEEEDDPTTSRTVHVGRIQTTTFPPNAVSNAKYTPWSFLPVTLYNEFSFFFNMYFLLVALSQAIPPLRIGYLSTYIVPLVVVLAITLGKEAYDDIGRRKRDAEANSEGYVVLQFDRPGANNSARYRTKGKSKSIGIQKSRGRNFAAADRLSDIQEEEDNAESQGRDPEVGHFVTVREVVKKSRDLLVGDVLKLGKDQRVPADLVILKSYGNESAVGVAPEASLVPENERSLLLVDPISDPAIERTDATEAGSRESASADGITPSADAGGAGETFIRTDQLDGETDWKLRLGSPLTQSMDIAEFYRLRVIAGKPDKKVNEFIGTIELHQKVDQRYDIVVPKPGGESSDQPDQSNADGVKTVPLTIDNTAWANTVLASNATTYAVIIYTGSQTRSALSTSPSRSKTGLLEYEINSLTKILCALTLSLSIVLVALEGFEHTINNVWYVKIMRFLVLFSTIVPISLRVNLDMGKTVYSWFIQRDLGMPGAVVRTSTIPEELGRIEYLLSDKTGTLTQNEMEMKKIHVGTVSYAYDAMDEITTYIKQGFSMPTSSNNQPLFITPSSTYVAATTAVTATRTRREIGSRVRDVVLALAICHNVTPTTDEENGKIVTSYQASSPDEIAIVRWTEAVGLRLLHRDRKGMVLQSVDSGRPVVRVRILEVFPFTSEGKRMGIIVQFYENTESSDYTQSGEIWFYQKGADTIMSSIVVANDWLDEETANMAREGLRTLVVGRKRLSIQQYQEFSARYTEASVAIQGRDSAVARVVSQYLERDLELLGVTGVEDKLQKDVKPSLELLRNAGIKIWMLTGDKVETARCVAVSAKLVARGQYVHTIAKLKRKDNAQDHLDFLRSKTDACLLVDGESLALLLKFFRDDFISLAVRLPAVVACRCSPTQKADIAKLIREYTKKRVCCIGDGGNDVSMIQAADVGVGIVGKEGRQASLAADFSIEQFCHLTKLLVWHGRNSYKRSAKLAQFVIHRGLIISVCQAMYSIAIKFEPEGLYKVRRPT